MKNIVKRSAKLTKKLTESGFNKGQAEAIVSLMSDQNNNSNLHATQEGVNLIYQLLKQQIEINKEIFENKISHCEEKLISELKSIQKVMTTSEEIKTHVEKLESNNTANMELTKSFMYKWMIPLNITLFIGILYPFVKGFFKI